MTNIIRGGYVDASLGEELTEKPELKLLRELISSKSSLHGVTVV